MRGSDRGDGEASLAAPLEGGEPSSWGPPGPDGGPMMTPAPATADAAPAFDAAHCPCLRGPCRYLHEVRTHFDHGNAPGTLERAPTQLHLSCMVQRGVFLEMSADAPVLECNRWDPEDPAQLAAVEHRRAAYFERHPEDRVQFEDLEEE